MMMNTRSSQYDDKKKAPSFFGAPAWSTPLLRNQFGAHPAALKPFTRAQRCRNRPSNAASSSSNHSAFQQFKVQLPFRMVVTTAAIFLLLPVLLFLYKEAKVMFGSSSHTAPSRMDIITSRRKSSKILKANPAWMEEGFAITSNSSIPNSGIDTQKTTTQTGNLAGSSVNETRTKMVANTTRLEPHATTLNNSSASETGATQDTAVTKQEEAAVRLATNEDKLSASKNSGSTSSNEQPKSNVNDSINTPNKRRMLRYIVEAKRAQ